MNKNFFAGLFVGLGLLAIFAFRPAEDKKAEEGVQKWEYYRLDIPAGWPKADKLNPLGNEGWELVQINGAISYFKRPLQ